MTLSSWQACRCAECKQILLDNRIFRRISALSNLYHVEQRIRRLKRISYSRDFSFDPPLSEELRHAALPAAEEARAMHLPSLLAVGNMLPSFKLFKPAMPYLRRGASKLPPPGPCLQALDHLFKKIAILYL